jgi:peptidyl-prolyl cis-trans isomerase SurA
MAVMATLIFALAGGPTTATAQDVQRIAAVVNDEVVSLFDLVQRMRLVIFSSGLEDSAEVRRRLGPQVLRRLIDERLQLQEAKRNNVTVSDQQTLQAVKVIEKQNQLPAGQLDEYLARNGISSETLTTRVRAEMSWVQLLRRQINTFNQIGEDEVDAEISRLEANRGLPQYRISEIYLVIESSDQEVSVRENANRLVEQIEAGGNFRVLARQFSDGVTATQGGDIGWVTENQLDDEVAGLVQTMEKGEVSDPIRVSGGYLIVKLQDLRIASASVPGGALIGLRQIILPLSRNAPAAEVEAQLELAETIGQSVNGCADMAATAAEVDANASNDLVKVRVGDMSDAIRNAVLDLPIGVPSKPVRSQAGVHVFMVCERETPDSDISKREKIREALISKRMEVLSRSYLRNLRRDAFVDIRI